MKFKLIPILSIGLLTFLSVEVNATVFEGSATGSWTTVDAANPYGGDGSYDPHSDPTPTLGQDIFHISNLDAGADAKFHWGLPEIIGISGTGTPTYPNSNSFTFNGSGSDGVLGSMDTDNPALNPFVFGTFDYFNGSTYYSRGINGVTLDIQFYIQDTFDNAITSFSMQAEFGIENISNWLPGGISNPTPDNVHLLNGASLSETFNYGGTEYQLDILGFGYLINNALIIRDDFSSPEGITSSANLYAQITEVPVPEPATMVLFGVGLVGLFGTKMRKKKD